MAMHVQNDFDRAMGAVAAALAARALPSPYGQLAAPVVRDTTTRLSTELRERELARTALVNGVSMAGADAGVFALGGMGLVALGAAPVVLPAAAVAGAVTGALVGVGMTYATAETDPDRRRYWFW